MSRPGPTSVVLELVPSALSRVITQRLSIPTIGIGAGAHCDGQVQVLHDMLGMYTDFVPKHARQYALLAEIMTDAFSRYIADVRDGNFPADKESFVIEESLLEELEALLAGRSSQE